jgi:hypothetical protein
MLKVIDAQHPPFRIFLGTEGMPVVATQASHRASRSAKAARPRRTPPRASLESWPSISCDRLTPVRRGAGRAGAATRCCWTRFGRKTPHFGGLEAWLNPIVPTAALIDASSVTFQGQQPRTGIPPRAVSCNPSCAGIDPISLLPYSLFCIRDSRMQNDRIYRHASPY